MSALIFLACFVGLLLIWIAFPLGVMALAWTAKQPSRLVASARHHRVSLIVVTRETAEAVLARIDNLQLTSYPAELLEILVAYDYRVAVPDGLETGLAARSVQLYRGDSPGGKATALNAAVRAATGDILVFADTYQRFNTDAIDVLTDAFADAGVAAVSGVLELPSGRSEGLIHDYWSMEIALRKAEAALHSTVGVFGPIWAMRRNLWEPLPAGLILDDVHTPMRLVLAGWRIAFAEGAVAIDLRRPEFGNEFRRKVRTQTGIFQLLALSPELLNPSRNPILPVFFMHKVGRLATAPLVLVMLIAAGTWVLGHPLPLYASLRPVAVAALLLCLAIRPVRERIASTVGWISTMCAALLVAAANGARRDWNVWR